MRASLMNQQGKIKDIVFDIGNVICEWNAQKLVAGLYPGEGERREAIEHIISHEDWEMLDKGVLSLEEAIIRADGRCSLGVGKIQRLFEETPKSLRPFPEAIDVIRALNAGGYRLYVLSNMHRHGFEYLSKALDIWRYFSGIVISSHVKSIKPEAAIFEYLIDTYGLVPERAVFLDDLRSNVDAARRLGFHAIHVRHAKQIKRPLFRKLGLSE